MPSGTVTAEISATVETVWEAITDLESAPSWVPDLISVRRVSSGSIGVGSQFEQVMRVQGREVEMTVTIRQFDPPNLIAHTGEGKSVKISGKAILEETSEGCRITNEWSLELSGFLKLAAPIAGNWTKNNIEESMQALKRRLE